MSGHFTLGSMIIAEATLTRIGGQPGLGFHRLVADVEFDVHGGSGRIDLSLSDLTGVMWLQGQGHPGNYLGQLHRQAGNAPIATPKYPSKQVASFEIEMDGRRLDAIEDVRAGRDLAFQLLLTANIVVAATGPREPSRSELFYQANQATWVGVLDGMGYRRTLLLEIPMPDQDAPEQLRQAVEYLRQAQDQMLHGKYREAVGACRDRL